MTVNKEKKPPKKITEKYLQNSGLYYLQRFPASRAHFEFIMMRKIKTSITHHETPTIEEAQTYLTKVANYFTDLGFLNDKKYALALSESLFRRGLSKKMIAHRLNQKGVPQDLIEHALEETLPENSELIAAIRLLKRRKYAMFGTSEDRKDHKKILGILARGGFSYQIANTTMELSHDEASDIISRL